jgi:hypothetical protein
VRWCVGRSEGGGERDLLSSSSSLPRLLRVLGSAETVPVYVCYHG